MIGLNANFIKRRNQHSNFPGELLDKTGIFHFRNLSLFIIPGLFVACLASGKFTCFELITSLVYGVFLEWMTIKQLSAYAYGHFLVMFDGAPLAVGVGWAVIIYSGMEFVKQLNMPAVARPFLVGFMALNIDVAMDAIAIRQGFLDLGYSDGCPMVRGTLGQFLGLVYCGDFFQRLTLLDANCRLASFTSPD